MRTLLILNKLRLSEAAKSWIERTGFVGKVLGSLSGPGP